MLTYEYLCEACKHTFTAEQNITDDPITVCPECGKEGSVQRLIAGSGEFILKGNNWASDHYGLKTQRRKTKSKKNNTKNSRG